MASNKEIVDCKIDELNRMCIISRLKSEDGNGGESVIQRFDPPDRDGRCPVEVIGEFSEDSVELQVIDNCKSRFVEVKEFNKGDIIFVNAYGNITIKYSNKKA